MQLNSFDYLMQLEVADEQLIAHFDEGEMQSQVIVGEYARALVFWFDFIVYQVSLGHGVIMI